MRSGRRVLVFPDWPGNPYLNILALVPRATGFVFEGADTVGQLIRQAATLKTGDVLHLHWTSPIAQDAQSRRAATRAVRRVAGLLGRLRRRGVGIVWTVHNRLPHEVYFAEQERALYRALAEHADVVHVMSRRTVDELRGVCDLRPGTVRLIPHPSYAGFYDTSMSRVRARDALGLREHDHAVLFFGQIRAYKGLDRLLRATAAAAEADARVVLLLAGRATEADRASILARMPDGLRVRSWFDFVPDEDVATWFAAADVVALPFESVLNSGSAHLAVTFGVPLALPATPPLHEVFGAYPGSRFFDPDAGADALATVLSPEIPAPRRSPASEDDDHGPFRTSLAYADLLRSLPLSRVSADRAARAPRARPRSSQWCRLKTRTTRPDRS